MYEDIFELLTHAAKKRNLNEATIAAYWHALSPFLNYINKPWKELTIADADDYLTAKRLAGVLPETYNHYYGHYVSCISVYSSLTGTRIISLG